MEDLKYSISEYVNESRIGSKDSLAVLSKALRFRNVRAVPEIIGGEALFCPVGGGCFVDNVSEGWGG